MECPACSCRLRRAKSHNVEVDVCTSCSGIWFDSGELHVLLRRLVESEKIPPESTRLFQRREVETADPSAAEIRSCPKCGMVLKTFNYAYDSNVFVDKCPECEGIWTDAGEVKRLARYLKTDPRVLEIGKHIHQRQKFLDELRDLGDLGQRLKRSGLAAAYMPRIILPVGDDLERERFPLITISIVVCCIAVFLYELFGVDDLEGFVNEYGFVASNFFSVGLITSMFLHADVFHIFGNLLFLWIFGDNVEDRFGRIGFLFFYMASDIAANILFAIFHVGSTIPCIGASGAISGVMGAYVLLYPNARLKILVFCQLIPVPAGVYLMIWFLMQIGYSLIALQSGQEYGVAWLAHVGGFAFGMGAAWLVKKYSLFQKKPA